MEMLNVPPRPDLEEQWKLTYARLHEWLDNEVFTVRWWVLLVLFCLTAFLWWRTVDKSRLSEITLYTLFVMLFIIVLDELGEELSLWYYAVDIIFLFPPITAVNITCMPLIYMLIYRIFRTWRSFTVATLIMSGVFCFVFEPIFVRGGIYVMLNWKSYYGFPIYAAIALISKMAVNIVYRRRVLVSG